MCRFLGAVLLPLLALVLSACGGDTVALNPVAKAAARTQAAGGVRAAMSGSFERGGLDGSFSASGIFGPDTGKGRMRMTFTAGSLAGETMEMIHDDSVGYMRARVFEKILPAGKHWLKIDPEKFASSLGINFQELTASSPNQALEQLRQASKSVEEIGDERVRGVMTTHYRAVLDPAKLELPAKLLEMTAPEYGPVDVWIDAKDMVRRETVSASSRLSGQDERVKMSFKMEFYDFGIQVDVEPPPDEEVLDVSELR